MTAKNIHFYMQYVDCMVVEGMRVCDKEYDKLYKQYVGIGNVHLFKVSVSLLA